MSSVTSIKQAHKLRTRQRRPRVWHQGRLGRLHCDARGWLSPQRPHLKPDPNEVLGGIGKLKGEATEALRERHDAGA